MYRPGQKEVLERYISVERVEAWGRPSETTIERQHICGRTVERQTLLEFQLQARVREDRQGSMIYTNAMRDGEFQGRNLELVRLELPREVLLRDHGLRELGEGGLVRDVKDRLLADLRSVVLCLERGHVHDADFRRVLALDPRYRDWLGEGYLRREYA